MTNILEGIEAKGEPVLIVELGRLSALIFLFAALAVFITIEPADYVIDEPYEVRK